MKEWYKLLFLPALLFGATLLVLLMDTCTDLMTHKSKLFHFLDILREINLY